MCVLLWWMGVPCNMYFCLIASVCGTGSGSVVTLNWRKRSLKVNKQIIALKCFAGFHHRHHSSRFLLLLKAQGKGVCLWRTERASSNSGVPRNLIKKSKWVFKRLGLLTSHVNSFHNNHNLVAFLKENIAPAVDDTSNSSSEEAAHSREITEEEIQDIWKNVTLTQ